MIPLVESSVFDRIRSDPKLYACQDPDLDPKELFFGSTSLLESFTVSETKSTVLYTCGQGTRLGASESCHEESCSLGDNLAAADPAAVVLMPNYQLWASYF
jgi:hypothetical protein